jgi:uncharacterized OsmC-like protein/pimeloyl-ACP methyl ester carboxylesterase
MATITRKLEFAGSYGAKLAARLDLPAGPVQAYALFAHCFTCSKDIFAASRIAAGLAGQGIAVLRFDFTGLGASEGEFASTNFSSNVDDLVHAADYLRDNFGVPELLIGHSLGGAAVLAAAARIPDARAIVTIGAPAEADHVIKNFGADISRIDQDGEAKVSLAGREFTIRKQFLDDVRGSSIDDAVANLKRPLLVMHAPGDQTVGIENAVHIFTKAKHPKSYVSLDTADHLLTKRADAKYAADIIAAWASRFVSKPDQKLDQALNIVRVSETGNGRFQQAIQTGTHRLIADEPESVGGLDSGPSPYDFLAMALGACTTMTLRMYADRKGLPLEHVSVDVDHKKVHAEDCENCEQKTGRLDRFERIIHLKGDLDDTATQRLLEIADRCPVHQTLERKSKIETRLSV